MKKNFLAGFALVGCRAQVYSQDADTDHQLENSLKQLVENFNGTAGVYVYNLKTKKEAAVYADTVFPTTSIVKVPVLVKLFDKIERGELYLNDSLVYSKDRIYGGSGLMQSTKNSEDESWETDNEAWELQRQISAFLWNYYEPDYGWAPAENADAFLRK